MSDIKLTEYSHGAGCGCKISPQILDQILQSGIEMPDFPDLLVGNSSKDDAAVFDMGNGEGVISTTDFFMPIVDDPFDFGRIAATNAISDVYAMGGTPMMAIAILGWPVNKLGPDVARAVVDGGRQACKEAGIPLAGGHSIDAPEPIFGLAVTGRVPLEGLKQNDKARVGDKLYLTKPLGIGILTTAQKKKKIADEHVHIARDAMCQLNLPGAAFAKLPCVSAMTDVTGFGLLGHLLEVCEGSGVKARIQESALPLLPHVEEYRAAGCVPGGTERNFASYGHKGPDLSQRQKELLCDPQTSGGLLVAVSPDGEEEFLKVASEFNLELSPVGELLEQDSNHLIEMV
ncbi:selenide, water dikinase SelD [Sansalvadorimonas sp. 2012CJ34-2]|uniref:Selenide, water dikinase n=1 Tax=Parendozoicomonas callyspongiae TaxID=2942213 RepID=A0ABT0PLC2_9GAMM|nr:selenide, water dikinase SelD [Sansalvadorimonas sp. 2012CJ34-2]MCL6271243.1 selenide, water dikinase SelD [Sansalvadorimonas sp. 2012CJ34-2]